MKGIVAGLGLNAVYTSGVCSLLIAAMFGAFIQNVGSLWGHVLFGLLVFVLCFVGFAFGSAVMLALSFPVVLGFRYVLAKAPTAVKAIASFVGGAALAVIWMWVVVLLSQVWTDPYGTPGVALELTPSPLETLLALAPTLGLIWVCGMCSLAAFLTIAAMKSKRARQVQPAQSAPAVSA